MRLLPGSEEHTSELQSHLNLVCRLLLEKKNTHTNTHTHPPSLSLPDTRAPRHTLRSTHHTTHTHTPPLLTHTHTPTHSYIFFLILPPPPKLTPFPPHTPLQT